MESPVASSPYDPRNATKYPFYTSVFLPPTTSSSSSTLSSTFMLGVVPLCVAYNVGEAVPLSVFPKDIVQRLGTSRGGGVVYSTSVVREAYVSLGSMSVAVPGPTMGTAAALLNSLQALDVLPRNITRIPVTSGINVFTNFTTEDDIAMYVKRVNMSMGIVSRFTAMHYHLPCMHTRAHNPQGYDAVIPPILNANSIDTYDVDPATVTVGVDTPDELSYPLVGPLVLSVSQAMSCANPTQSSSLAMLDYALLSSDYDDLLTQFGCLPLDTLTSNTVLYQAMLHLCSQKTTFSIQGEDDFGSMITTFVNARFEGLSEFAHYDISDSDAASENVRLGKAILGITERRIPTSTLSLRPSLQAIPLVAFGVSVAINLHGDYSVSLTIPRCFLPAILNGTVRRWNHPTLEEWNPGIHLPDAAISIVVPINDSGMVEIITGGIKSLELQCLGAAVSLTSATAKWPFDNAIHIDATSEGILASYVITHINTMTFLMSSTAKSWQFGVTTIVDEVTESEVTPSVDIMRSTMTLATFNTDTLTIQITQTDRTYCFVGTIYAVYDRNGSSDICNNLSSALFMLEWILSDSDAIDSIVEKGLTPLPSRISRQSVHKLHTESMCGGKHVFPQPPEPEDTTPITIGVSIGVIMLAILAVGGVIGYRKYSMAKAIRYAPKDNTKPFGIAVLSIKREADMWIKHPVQMGSAVARYYQIVREVMKRHAVHEVKLIGNAMIVASIEAEVGDFASDVVRSVQAEDWGRILPSVDLKKNRVNRAEQSMSCSTRSGASSQASHSNPASPYSRRPRDNEVVTISNSTSCSRSRSLSRQNSSARSRVVDTFDYTRLQVGAGVHFSSGTILYNATTNVYDYGGPIIDHAALLADSSQGGQVLVSSNIAPLLRGTTRLYHQREDSRGKKVELLQYTAPGDTETEFQAPDENSSNTDNGVLAALEQKNAGVTKKTITVVTAICRNVDKAQAVMEPAEFSKYYAQFVGDMYRLVDTLKGHIESYCGGCFVISLNARQPSPRHHVKAFTVLAKGILSLCGTDNGDGSASSQHQDVSIGISSGKATVGTFGDSTPWSHTSTVGHVASASYTLAQLCTSHMSCRGDIKILTTHHEITDIQTAVQYQYIDIVQGNVSLRPVGIVAVMKFIEEGESDEWMYQLESSEAADPYAALNNVYESLMNNTNDKAEMLNDEVLSSALRHLGHAGRVSLVRFVTALQETGVPLGKQITNTPSVIPIVLSK
eukprot:PhF_6_TR17053/c0_g1_i2/m.26008